FRESASKIANYLSASIFQGNLQMVISTSLQTNNCAQNLSEATQNILENAFYIAKQKLELSRKAYKKLIKEWGWEKEDKKYLKVAQTFKKFSPSDLAEIEPNTLFLLSNQSKKYAPVIEQLLDIGSITQKKVRELIKKQRKPKPIKPEKPSIWRRTKNGGRYCQVPPIHDQETGVILQKLMDSTGKTAQELIGESLKLQLALLERRDCEVPQTTETEVSKVETQESSVSHESSENELENNEQSVIEIDSLENDVDKSVFSDEIILNPTTNQKTVEFLSNELEAVVENFHNFDKEQVKEAEKLVAQIIDYCNIQPIEEQWNTLASITHRDIKALKVVIDNSGNEYKDWLLNLPRLLAKAVLENPEELDWVDKKLREEALLIISKSTAFSATS
ncbi:MAG: hypothetical protein SWZ49_30560, partial [Cyanobacteriota bacterium]|nr:hypothetical protein [Cyanobacteriota bacterium]